MPELARRELDVVTCDSVAFAIPKAIDKHVNATVVGHPDSSDNHVNTNMLSRWIARTPH